MTGSRPGVWEPLDYSWVKRAMLDSFLAYPQSTAKEFLRWTEQVDIKYTTRKKHQK